MSNDYKQTVFPLYDLQRIDNLFDVGCGGGGDIIFGKENGLIIFMNGMEMAFIRTRDIAKSVLVLKIDHNEFDSEKESDLKKESDFSDSEKKSDFSDSKEKHLRSAYKIDDLRSSFAHGHLEKFTKLNKLIYKPMPVTYLLISYCNGHTLMFLKDDRFEILLDTDCELRRVTSYGGNLVGWDGRTMLGKRIEQKSGQSEEPPDKTEQKSGQSEEPPDKTEEKPGQFEQKPGQSEQKPGQSEQKSGQSEQKPGQSEQKPGHSEEKPGQSEEPPDKTEQKSGQSEEKPDKKSDPFIRNIFEKHGQLYLDKKIDKVHDLIFNESTVNLIYDSGKGLNMKWCGQNVNLPHFTPLNYNIYQNILILQDKFNLFWIEPSKNSKDCTVLNFNSKIPISSLYFEKNEIFLGLSNGKILILNKSGKKLEIITRSTEILLPVSGIIKKNNRLVYCSINGCIGEIRLKNRRFYLLILIALIMAVVAVYLRKIERI
ncbi:Allantoate permease [Pseudoloma neurophilia]|uniref:Allantoate permease n=1 Tax=Pseudoloma neurophilia TaxID=146866 RepID=A0A0R0M7A2_9MICR|nr:Allantoate permease [Pseudoloma neurophilia]